MATAAFELHEKVESLQVALLAAHPRMPALLQDIHKLLRSDPANVTLLSEDEIATIVSSLKIQTKTEIATSMTKNKAGKTLKSISADDL